MPGSSKNLIFAVTGASGALYARTLLREVLRHVEGRSALILSPAALRVYETEHGKKLKTPEEYLNSLRAEIPTPKHSFELMDYHDIGARAASGSVAYEGMAIVPCSMKTLSGIAHGYTSNLIERAADVCLKERRRLIVMPREAPYSLIHLKNMTALTEAGGIVLPASPGYYHRPQSLEDLSLFLAARVFALLGLEASLIRPYGSPESSSSCNRPFITG